MLVAIQLYTRQPFSKNLVKLRQSLVFLSYSLFFQAKLVVQSNEFRMKAYFPSSFSSSSTFFFVEQRSLKIFCSWKACYFIVKSHSTHSFWWDLIIASVFQLQIVNKSTRSYWRKGHFILKEWFIFNVYH